MSTNALFIFRFYFIFLQMERLFVVSIILYSSR